MVGWRGGGTAWENTPRPLQPPAQREPRVGTAWPVNERRDTRKPGGHSRSIRAAGGKEQAGARAEEKMGVHGLAWCRVSVRTQHRVQPRAGLRETPSSEAEGHGGRGWRAPCRWRRSRVQVCLRAPAGRGGEGRAAVRRVRRVVRVDAAVLARGGAGDWHVCGGLAGAV